MINIFPFLIIVLGFLLGGCAGPSNLSNTGLTPKIADRRQGENAQERFCISCKYSQVGSDKTGLIQTYNVDGVRVKLICDSEWVRINQENIRLPYPTKCETDKVWVSPSILSYVKNISTFGLNRTVKVVIDPGHGGKDPGAMGNGLREKDVVLDIAQRLAKYLRRAGVKVYMTRNSDVFIPLKERARKANNIMPDVFVSIHANASRNRTGKGVEVYYVSEKINDSVRAVVAKENSVLRFENGQADGEIKQILWDMMHTENRAESRRIAQSLARNISQIMNSPNRGVKGAPFYVLKWTNVPSVLIEVGFVSNPEEARKLSDPVYRDRIARAIFEGLMAYFSNLRKEELRH